MPSPIPPPSPPKRRYHLSDAGRAALRAAAMKHQPWTHSTGPRTVLGKAISRQNGLRHGLYAAANPDAAAYAAHVSRLRRAAAAGARAAASGPVVA